MAMSIKSVYDGLRPAVETSINNFDQALQDLDSGDIQIQDLLKLQAEMARTSQTVSLSAKSIESIKKMGESVLQSVG